MRYLRKSTLAAILLATVSYAESERYIHGTCRITGIRSVAQGTTATWTDPCILETPTLPAGFNNYYRFIVELSGPVPIATDIGPMPDFVKAQNSQIGTISFSIPLWGKILFSPNSMPIRTAIASRAADLTSPAQETRAQTVTLSQSERTLNILIEEAQSDFYFGVPSADWKARHDELFKRLSHSR